MMPLKTLESFAPKGASGESNGKRCASRFIRPKSILLRHRRDRASWPAHGSVDQLGQVAGLRLPPGTASASSDTDLIDDAIREVLIHRLYQQRVLEKNSPYAHFDPNHPSPAGEELEKKVSAYLVYTFKNGVREARDFVREVRDFGTCGALGRQPGGPPLQMASFSGVKSKAKKSRAEPAPLKRLNISRKDAAFMLGVCEGTVDNYRNDGRLKSTHKGRRILISIAEVERLAATDDPEPVRRVDPPGPKPVTSVKDPKHLVKPKRG
jgi:hypothetical protein